MFFLGTPSARREGLRDMCRPVPRWRHMPIYEHHWPMSDAALMQVEASSHRQPSAVTVE
jgi:hypothetical protein